MATVRLAGFAEGISGKMGNLRFFETEEGTVMKQQTPVTNPKTTAQQTVRSDFSTVSKLYKTLTTAQKATWKTYAGTLSQVSKRSGKAYMPKGFNLFTGLSTKYLLINPGGTVPLTAPTGPFDGDTVAVTTATATGKITFTANKANAESVKTELLLQRLVSAGREPQPGQYRTQQYIAFATGSLSASVTLTPGTYAPAYRFVSARTGQEAGIVTLPVVTVS